VLRRRLEHLEARISASRSSDGVDLSFDRAECAALRSAIHAVERTIIPTEGTALVLRDGRDGGAQLLLVTDGDEVAEVNASIIDGRVQLVAKGDVLVRWDSEVESADVG
jgi:hypothetical protein